MYRARQQSGFGAAFRAADDSQTTRQRNGDSVKRSVLVLLSTAALTCAAPASAQVTQWGAYRLIEHAKLAPSAVTNLSHVTAVDAGNTSGYALESNGTMWAWGENGYGQLGDGLTKFSYTAAVQVGFPPAVSVAAIGEAQNSGFGIDSTGRGWAFGQNGDGSLCLGADGEKKVRTPVPIASMTEAVQVQGGGHHVVWLLANGTVAVCGENSNGQLGLPRTVKKATTPTLVPGLSEVVQVSAGMQSSCARTASGAVYDWGLDLTGQVGNGKSEKSVYTPYHVPLPGPASAISCGGNLESNGHNLAIVEGAVYGWGADADGQIGDGQTTDKYTPVPAGNVNAFPDIVTQVVASGVSSVALTAAGEVLTWGKNEGGDLGVNSGNYELVAASPASVLTGAAAVSATAETVVTR